VSAATVTLDQQIACVAREIALRKAVYPQLIARGKMTPEKAALEQEHMEGVMMTLKLIREMGGLSAGARRQ
jgi:hypothetical protein